MSNENLTTYLKDHHTGSVAALELVDHLIETFEGKSLEQFFKSLRKEIDADQGKLQELTKKAGAKESAVRKAGAWVAEKFARMKVRINDSEKDQMGLLNAPEALLIGITGKEALWSALEAASKNVASLRGVDYARLRHRAREQRDLVDAKRLEWPAKFLKQREPRVTDSAVAASLWGALGRRTAPYLEDLTRIRAIETKRGARFARKFEPCEGSRKIDILF
jgi:hypothetical protein